MGLDQFQNWPTSTKCPQNMPNGPHKTPNQRHKTTRGAVEDAPVTRLLWCHWHNGVTETMCVVNETCACKFWKILRRKNLCLTYLSLAVEESRRNHVCFSPLFPGLVGMEQRCGFGPSAFYSEHFDLYVSSCLISLFSPQDSYISRFHYQGHLSHRRHRGEKRLDATILICLGQSGMDSAAMNSNAVPIRSLLCPCPRIQYPV